MPHKKPNILFAMMDHGRADSLGVVRAGAEVTPNLNRLAAEGAAFTRAYTTCPLCVPARTALATGVYPTRNGVVYNDWAGDTARDISPIHQCLANAGYRVAHVGVHHIRVQPPLPERVPFDLWVDNGDYDAYLRSLDPSPLSAVDRSLYKTPIVENQNGTGVPVSYSNVRADRWPGPAPQFKDAYFAHRAIEFLETVGDEPFALFLYLWAPHPPLLVPEPYFSRFDPKSIDLPANVGRPAEGEPPSRRRGIAAQLAEGISEEQWRRAWAAHLGLTNLADACIGTVLSRLDELGLSDTTATFFTSDHGEQLGQHRMYQKMEMYEPAIHVPLIARVPGGEPRRIDSCVSHLDLFPTLADLAGISVPTNGGDLHPEGRSLVSALRGADIPERPVFAQYNGNPTYGDRRRTIVTQRYKFTYDETGTGELYDLEADPLEMVNLAESSDHASLARQLEAQCRRFHAESRSAR
jgi:arylsulfatase A-like enzyme